MATFINFNRGPAGLQIKDDQQLNHLTISNKAVINCATLTSQGVNCEALDVIGDSTFNGTLVMNGTFFACDISCPTTLTISADDFVQDITNGITINALNFGATVANNISLRGDSINMGADSGKITITGREEEVLIVAGDGTSVGGVKACVTTVGHMNSRDAGVSKYKPTINITSWTGIASLTNGSTDTAGKIQLDTPAVVGDVIRILFGTPFANPPVVQATLAGSATVPQAFISIQQVSGTAIILRLDGNPNPPNSLIHYTVIGQSDQ
jgi:hypothetical protein